MTKQDELVTSCDKLVQSLARKYAGSHGACSLEDLAGEGYVGLLQAAQKFQPGRGIRFSTFAAPRIRGAMLDLLRRESPLSRPMATHVAKLKAEQDALWVRLGREPTQAELARRLPLSIKKANEVLGFRALRVISLDMQTDELGADVADSSASPEDLAVRNCVTRELTTYLARLQPQDREIIERIYWWHQKHIEVAVALGISASRVSQRRARALQRLREMITADGYGPANYLQAA